MVVLLRETECTLVSGREQKKICELQIRDGEIKQVFKYNLLGSVLK